MRGLTAHNVLDIWEWSQSQHTANTALGLLYAAYPEFSWEQLAGLSIGQRDAYLLALREKTFGETMQVRTKCQHCGEALEFAISTHDVGAEDQSVESEYTIEIQDNLIRFRLPNSKDLLAVSQEPDNSKAGDTLLQRCLIDVTIKGEPSKKEELPEEVVTTLVEHMAQCDPAAEVLLNIRCPTCELKGQVLFDINSYYWAEFVDLARRLMQQVSVLAHGYGWAEADILTLSAWRRQYYQDMLSA